MGGYTEEGFNIVLQIDLKRHRHLEKKFNHHGNHHVICNVDGVYVKDGLRGNGFATNMYRYLISKQKINILGDEIQYQGARFTWVKLAKMDDVIVDIIDIDSDKVVEKDVTLHHGVADWEFDERVWDYSDIKKHIRLLLTKVL